MSRKERHELDIWYSNWRAGWKLQTKDMNFSRSERGMEFAPIPSSTKHLKSSGMVKTVNSGLLRFKLQIKCEPFSKLTYLLLFCV